MSVSLELEKHRRFIVGFSGSSDSLQHSLSDYLRINGIYWSLCGLSLMDPEYIRSDFNEEEIISFTLACRNGTGGFGGFPGFDASLVYTLSAIQVLALYDALDRIEDVEKTVSWIASLQHENGSFQGDHHFPDVDTRFVYCAVASLSILDRLDAIDCSKTISYIVSCQNWDGGFGLKPGRESHAAQAFCCVGAVSILKSVDSIDKDSLVFWLSTRQDTNTGGLNGRPDKDPDVCYSWWVVSTLAILDSLSFIDVPRLVTFVRRAQDVVDGGIADRPEHMADIYHTFFGLAGIALLDETGGLKAIDPTYALPVDVVARILG
ncbi:Prenyltransferase-like [Carpediemonas membranifera]|uniref:Geranylgeranyl transferase type-2 subunit beta n=1 Tax=Carpediemonas membranifera TaxID=201153 RepID=A0A8J6EB99_9EUKA|nr:Prenyltransferase-like [Carpediemonas membranifera]|eukprot:KAG9396640.1 Prenyltransferase-like [Carpediemonas membranifera]